MGNICVVNSETACKVNRHGQKFDITELEGVLCVRPEENLGVVESSHYFTS